MGQIITSYNTLVDDFCFHHSLTNVKPGRKDGSPPYSHRQFEILYLMQGKIKYLIEGEEYLVNKGDVIFVPPHEIHSLETIGDGAYEIKNIMFQIAHGKDEKMLPLFALAKILDLIRELEKIFTKSSMGGFPMSVDPIVKKAVEYVSKNIESPLSLDQIANALFISKSTLCHKFVSSMNISVNRYVTIKKIFHSAKLIKEGMGAMDAAIAVGYNQYTTFYHNYKKILGVPPSGKAK